MNDKPIRRGGATVALATLLVVLGAVGHACAQTELTYEQYRGLAWAADRLDHLAAFEPLQGEVGMYFAVAERFGTVQVYKADGRGVSRVWRSNILILQ